MSFTLPALPLRFTDANGNPLAGCKMYVFQAGTTTPATFYTDSALSVAATNPLVADSGGLFTESYLAVGTYKIRFTTSDGSTLWETDDYKVVSESAQISFPTSVKTANFAVTADDRGKVFLVNASGPGSISVSADSATLGDGFPFFIVNTGATGTITFTGVSAQTIDGSASKSLTSQYSAFGIVSIGATGWQTVMSSNSGDFTTPVSFSSTVTFNAAASIVGGPLLTPQGRLTITSATPVLTSDTTAQTTVYYTPYTGNRIALPTASGWSVRFFAELSQTLADVAKSPGAAAVNSVYDMFVWDDGGTIRCTRGPAWSSSTSRGTGAGTSELERKDGVLVNKVAITNGPAANRGVYVGTIATSGSGANGQLNMMFSPTPAAGGTANRLDVWNMYNRGLVSSFSRESTDSWTYTTATWRSMNNSTSNRITLIAGLNEDAVSATMMVSVGPSGSITTRCGIGLDSTSAPSGIVGIGRSSGAVVGNPGLYASLVTRPGLGVHFFQALEWSEASGTTTWYGDNAEPTNYQAGIQATWLC